MKNQFVRLSRKVSAILVALAMTVVLAVSAFAADANEAVQADTNGVIQVRVVYYNDMGSKDENISVWGTGFLINDSTVVTSNHVVSLSDDSLAAWAEAEGVDVKTLKDRLKIEVVVMNDLTIQASILNASSEMDFAILKLSQQIYDRNYLPIRNSDEVSATESVYALGYPGEVADTQVFNTFTSSDVTISAGTVSKMNQVNNVDVVMTNAKITSGASGGPLVDANGNVIGINMGSTGDGLWIGNTNVQLDKNYFYHVASSQLIKALNALGIEYTAAGSEPIAETPAAAETPVATEAPAVEETPAPEATVDKGALSAKIDEVNALVLKDYTDDSVDALNAALTAAVTVNSNANATQADVDSAYQALANAENGLEAKGGIPIALIIAIVAAAAVVIVIIIVVVVKKNGKKNKESEVFDSNLYNGGAPNMAAANVGGFNAVPPTPVQARPVQMPAARPAGQTTVLSQGAGETTVLNQGSSETTVLNQNFGTLTRTRNHESVKINKAEFIIGRERSRVDYCISDNTNVGRAHAKILNRGGTAYLVDMNATNGTFLNSVKVSGTQAALKNGDKITLADEEFTFSI